MRGRRLLLMLVVAAMVLAGCGGAEDQAQDEETSPSEGQTAGEEQVAGEPTSEEDEATEEVVGADEVTVGGFVVESPGVPERSVPEVSVEPEDAREYLDQVRPIVEDTVSDVSGLIEPEVRIEDGSVGLDVEVGSLEEARNSVQSGLDRLREVNPPEGLEPINQQLIEAYEQALPAYDDIIQAAESEDPARISAAVQENLPRIEQFNDEVNSILQDLEQAANDAR